MSELNFEISCDWDLQAIVKEGQTKVIGNIIDEMPFSYTWLDEVEDYYQNQENATLLLNESHQICTPNHQNNNIISSSNIILDDNSMECPIDEPSKKVEDVSYAKNSEMAPIRRRSKFKKTMVHQATSDRVSSDKWNWRKYGEKIIKGSPYPRSYYRCSNSGACLARKQVEQCSSDPNKFIITYIDEHTHPYPTRRPSQAGRNSRRFHASSNQSPLATSRAKSVLVVGKDDDTSSVGCVVEGNVCVPHEYDFGDEFFLGLDCLEMDVFNM
ncbi:hypothetical protein RND81_06G246700 [Saponaria officinalis]|uniref:WRKY domain-containing protein n=1 Tax=Saponaria officinalis TaxID=3572 RepID=A0AAW1KDW6_SAPOF